MPQFEFTAQRGTSWNVLGVDIRDLVVRDIGADTVVMTTTGPGGGMMSLRFHNGQLQLFDQVLFPDGMRGDISGTTALLEVDDTGYAVLGGSAGGAVGFALQEDGGIGAVAAPDLPLHAGASGPVIATSAAGVVYTMTAEGRLQGFREEPGGLRAITTHVDNAASYAADPVALEVVRVGGQEFLVALCGQDTGISTFAIHGTTGALTHVAGMGAGEGLGLLANPTDMAQVTLDGTTYLLVTSAADTGGGGALTVAQLGADGSLQITDHILDSRDTRFGTASTLETTQVGDWTYIVAGGGDSGLSLFTLLPSGRLLHLDTFEDTNEAGLETISALGLVTEGTDLHVLAASQGSTGLAQMTIDLAQQGIVAEAAAGRLDGQGRNDLLVGDMGDNAIYGYQGNDTLVDGYGQDQLWGGAGADTFVFEADGQTDTIRDFQAGIDRIDLSAVPFLYSTARLSVTEHSWGATLTLPGNERIEIRTMNNTPLTAEQIFDAIDWDTDRPPLILFNEVTGSDANEVVQGGSGTDVLRGMDGDDVLSGMAGDDRLEGGGGNDTLNGGTGNDVLSGGLASDSLIGGEGNDQLDGGVGDDTLRGDAGNDLVQGGAGNDILDGGAGADRLQGGAGSDTLYGGWNNDVLEGGAGADRILAGGGNDVVTEAAGDVANDSIWAGAGHDTITAGAGDDLVYGEDGDDRALGGLGNDTLVGGEGNDVLMGESGADHLEGQGGNDQLQGGDGHDSLEGGAGADQLQGDGGNDSLEGGAGNDVLTGGMGHDTLDGGVGNDNLNGGALSDLLIGGEGNDTLLGALGNDTLQGQGGNDLLVGGNQNDFIDGGTGADHLLGGGNRDTLNGGMGNDTIEGQFGFDVINGGSGADWIHGGSMSDTLIGGAGNDTVNGGAGADRAWLGAGNDLFNGFFQWGHLGRDSIWGGAGNDTIMASAGNDVVYGQADNDLVSGGLGADFVSGGWGRDTLWGGGGNDVLQGGAGNDRLDGGRGADQMTGGGGADYFIFNSAGGRDVITDFQANVDHLVFDGTTENWFYQVELVNAPRGVWVVWSEGSVLLEDVRAADLDRGDMLFW